MGELLQVDGDSGERLALSDNKSVEEQFQRDGKCYLYCLNIHKSLYNYT